MRKDIIKDNRLVSDKTFAIRLLSFLQGVTVSDVASAEELEYIKSVADSLLNYQLYTVEDSEEAEYLKRLGHLPIKPTLTTHDGVQLFLRYDPIKVYTCMESPGLKDTPAVLTLYKQKDVERLNKKRLLFWDEQKCIQYIEDNTKLYSKSDLEKMGIKL